jgi:hypothetical protein
MPLNQNQIKGKIGFLAEVTIDLNSALPQELLPAHSTKQGFITSVYFYKPSADLTEVSGDLALNIGMTAPEYLDLDAGLGNGIEWIINLIGDGLTQFGFYTLNPSTNVRKVIPINTPLMAQVWDYGEANAAGAVGFPATAKIYIEGWQE